ncbi:MAG TPA: hypothetical protein DDW30_03290 [Clostridiales bacterium]|nr:hypothetical protein [Clostridiales bacterium]
MRNDISIRFGTPAEREALWREYPAVKNVLRDGGYFLVAIQNDTVVGFLWAFRREIPAPVERDEIFINIIDVIYTNLRCQGIASAMVEEVIRVAKAENVYQVRAYCDIGNLPSHRLWLKNGFSISPVKLPDGSIIGSFVSYVL